MKAPGGHLPVLAALFAVPFLICSCSPSPVSRVRAYESAYNEHNVPAVLALCTDDVVFQSAGLNTLIGKQAIRGMAEYDSVMGVHVQFSNIVTRKDTVFFDAAETNEWFRTAGINVVHHQSFFVFKGALIRHIGTTWNARDEKAVRLAVRSFLEWVTREKPDRIKELMPQGKFLSNAESATEMLALVRDWRKTTGRH